MRRHGLFGEGDQVALEALGLDGGFLLGVYLVEAGADPQEDAPRAYRGQAAFVEALAELDDVFDAVGFGEEASTVEGIDVEFGAAGLVAAEEMSGQKYSGDREAEASRNQKKEEAEADLVADAAVQDAVEVAVFGIVEILGVAGEF